MPNVEAAADQSRTCARKRKKEEKTKLRRQWKPLPTLVKEMERILVPIGGAIYLGKVRLHRYISCTLTVTMVTMGGDLQPGCLTDTAAGHDRIL